LTRRSLLARAAAAGGALLAPAAAKALAAPPHGEVFSMPLPDARAGIAAAGRWTTTEVLRAPKRFDLLGVEWRGAASVDIELRARKARGSWTPWVAVPSGHGHAPDSGSKRLVTDPVWAGGADEFQLRSSHPLRGARMHFVNATGTATAADRARTALRRIARPAAYTLAEPQLAAGPGQPPIIARGNWATPACRPRRPAYYGQMDISFVHHTVSLNRYHVHQSAALVRSICLFHRNVRGWNDIGYNFLVDRYGQIFEGRAGGIDEPLGGAQAGGYNLVSTGIAMLGTFSSAPPPELAIQSLASLLAWKLSLHGIAAIGRTTVEVSPYGHVYSRYPAGAQVSLNHVSGHRDADTTSCPGNRLYRRLPHLRRLVAQLQGPIGTLDAQPVARAFSYPNPATLQGTLTSAGEPIGGAQVELQQRTAKGERTLAMATTNPDGTFSVGAPLQRNATLRALYRGSPGLNSAVVSRPVGVAIAPGLTLSAPTSQTTVGVPVVFSGTITPVKPRVTLVVSQLQLDGTWLEVRQIRVAANPDGTYSRGVAFSSPGQYQVVAHTAPDNVNATGTSAPVAITVV
jgi:hypothetical protein